MNNNRLYFIMLFLTAAFLGFSAAGCKNTPTDSVLIKSISLEDEVYLNKNASITLTPVISPNNATNKNVWWLNDFQDIVEVDQNGVVTAVAAGEAVITALARDGSRVTNSIKIIVPEYILVVIESIDFKDESYSLFAGEKLSLGDNLISVPAADIRNFSWSTNKADIADINQSGLVTGISSGDAVITVTSHAAPVFSANIPITVKNTSGSVLMTPQEIFNSLKGQKVTTFGWADMANGGEGLHYANPDNFIMIDDTAYPNAADKYRAFINANYTNPPDINTVTGVISSGTINDNPKFIFISGDIDLSNGRINDNDKSFYNQFGPAPNYNRINGDIILNMGSNTTIIGIDNARIKFGGIRINNKSGIIIRNITFWDAHGSTDQNTAYFADSKAGIDALVIRGTSDGVWVDHCKFTNGTCTDMIRNYNHDGALDIPQGKNVTVTWCEFTNYDKVMLVAGSDSLTNVFERQITLHHNYFHYATQRMPRTRGTQMHVYNNYYNDIGVPGNTGYAMGPGVNAHFIVENNFFGSILSNRVTDYYDNPAYPAIVWSSGNNKEVRRSSHDKGTSKPWSPAYNYSLEDANTLPESIPPLAGPTLVFRK